MRERLLRSIVVLCIGWPWAGLALGEGPSPGVVVAWAGGPMEARIAFDRAVDPELVRRVVGESIGFGEGEKPGEAGRPGGDRGSLRVAAARLVDEGRTLVLVTDPHPRESTYRLALPGVKVPGEPGPGRRIEVSYDLGGVEAVLTGKGSKWSTWWPSLDPSVARQFTFGSAEHSWLRGEASRAGDLAAPDAHHRPEGRRHAQPGRFRSIRGDVRSRDHEVGRVEGRRQSGDLEGRVDRRAHLLHADPPDLESRPAPNPGGDRPRAAAPVGVRAPLGPAGSSDLARRRRSPPRCSPAATRPRARRSSSATRPSAPTATGSATKGGSSAPTSRAWPAATGPGSTGTSTSRAPRSTPITSRTR